MCTTILAILENRIDFVGIFNSKRILVSKVIIGKLVSAECLHVHHHVGLKLFVVDFLLFVIFIQPCYSDRNSLGIFAGVDPPGVDVGLGVDEVDALPLLGELFAFHHQDLLLFFNISFCLLEHHSQLPFVLSLS